MEKNPILVIGDAMIDTHIYCESNRLSPEAPVPICFYEKEETILGGAGNVAAQINVLNPCIFVHLNGSGNNFNELCQKKNIERYGLYTNKEYPIPHKTRIWANKQQICRIDKELSQEEIKKIDNNHKQCDQWCEYIKQLLINRAINIVILSDYNKGTLPDYFMHHIIQFCQENSIITLLDPKKSTYYKISGVTIVTPNNAEIQKTMLEPEKISQQMDETFLVCTRGGDGMYLYQDGVLLKHQPACSVEVADTCGAGDIVVATLGLFLNKMGAINNIIMEQAIKVATAAAARSVTHHGNYILTKEEMQWALSQS